MLYLESLKAGCHIILFYLTKPTYFLQGNSNLQQVYQMTGRLLKEVKTIFSTRMLVLWEIVIYLRNLNLQKSVCDSLLPFCCAMNVTVSISQGWCNSATQSWYLKIMTVNGDRIKLLVSIATLLLKSYAN